MYGCDLSRSKFCRGGFNRVMVGGELSCGVEYGSAGGDMIVTVSPHLSIITIHIR